MTGRYRLPARRPVDGYALVPGNVVEPIRNGSWVEKALSEHVDGVHDIAKSIADAGVFEVSEVLTRHGLIDGRLDLRDLDVLHRSITGVVARLIHNRLTERLGDGRRNQPVARDVAFSVLVREYNR